MISSIVVNYQTPGDLDRFCESYDGYTTDELIIVNVSPAETDNQVALDWAMKIGASTISFTENIGYARAVNIAAAGANGDVLAIFNADVVLNEGALHTCVDHLLSRPDWAILGPLQVNSSGDCTHPGIFGTQEQPTWREGGWKHPVRDEWRELRDDAVTVMGSAYFIRKDVWDELTACQVYQDYVASEMQHPAQGAFLPTPHYFEETACSYHAAAHGYRVVFDGTVEIIHEWHQASRVGGKADSMFPVSQQFFRGFCKAHGIPCD